MLYKNYSNVFSHKSNSCHNTCTVTPMYSFSAFTVCQFASCGLLTCHNSLYCRNAHCVLHSTAISLTDPDTRWRYIKCNPRRTTLKSTWRRAVGLKWSRSIGCLWKSAKNSPHIITGTSVLFRVEYSLYII